MTFGHIDNKFDKLRIKGYSEVHVDEHSSNEFEKKNNQDRIEVKSLTLDLISRILHQTLGIADIFTQSPPLSEAEISRQMQDLE